MKIILFIFLFTNCLESEGQFSLSQNLKFREKNDTLKFNKRFKLSVAEKTGNIYIDNKIVFASPSDSLVRLELFFKKYLIISIFDTSYFYVSAGLRYWKKKTLYIVNLKLPQKKYKADFNDKYGSESINSINESRRIIYIKPMGTDSLIKINMREWH